MGNTVVCSVMGLPIATLFLMFAGGFCIATMLWLGVDVHRAPRDRDAAEGGDAQQAPARKGQQPGPSGIAQTTSGDTP